MPSRQLVSSFLCLQRQILVLSAMASVLLSLLTSTAWKHTHKYKRKLRKVNLHTNHNKPQKRWQPARKTGRILTVDIYARTGLFEDEFENLFQSVKEKISQRRLGGPTMRVTPTTLTPRFRLLLVLHWLRHYLRYSTLGELYGISQSQVSREIHHILPKIYVTLREIEWPSRWMQHPFEGVVGAIDCTAHFRWRVHPKQADYYRGDKHAFFLSAQVVCLLNGEIVNVVLGLGHNNDAGMFKLTGLKEMVISQDLKLLADRGYPSIYTVRPDDAKGQAWNNQQASLRSVVEGAIGLVKFWDCAALTFKQSPELHALAIMICYHLTNLIRRRFFQ